MKYNKKTHVKCELHHLIERCVERGYDIEEAKACIVDTEGDKIIVNTTHPKYPKLQDKIAEAIRNPPEPKGAGTELKKLLSLVGITASPNCSCNKRAKAMDDRGISWCENNISLIVDWLQEEATKRKLPFIRYAGTKIVKLAIHRAKKKEKTDG